MSVYINIYTYDSYAGTLCMWLTHILCKPFCWFYKFMFFLVIQSAVRLQKNHTNRQRYKRLFPIRRLLQLQGNDINRNLQWIRLYSAHTCLLLSFSFLVGQIILIVWGCHCGTIKHTPRGAITQWSPVFLSVTTEEGLQYLVPFTQKWWMSCSLIRISMIYKTQWVSFHLSPVFSIRILCVYVFIIYLHND